MTWTTFNFTFNQVLTSTEMNNLYANFAAMAAGDSGAPKITPAAIQQSGTWDFGTADIDTTGDITASNMVVGGTALSELGAVSLFSDGRLFAYGTSSSTTPIVRVGNSTTYLGLGTLSATYNWIQSFGSVPLAINPQGNDVLIGKTLNDSGATAGTEIFSGGLVYATRSAGAALALNRLTSVGDIAIFKYAGTQYGAIGIDSAEIYIKASANWSLMVTSADLRPRTFAASGNNDNAIDLGVSTSRWRNGHFGGYVSADSVLVGTTSAVSGFKLDVRSSGGARVGADANQGAELGWSVGGSIVFFQGYNRGTSSWVDTVYGGATVGIQTGGTTRWLFNSSGNFIPQSTYNIGDTSNHVGTFYVLQVAATQAGDALSNAGVKVTRSGNTAQYGMLANYGGATWLVATDTAAGGNNILVFGVSTNGTSLTEGARVNTDGTLTIASDAYIANTTYGSIQATRSKFWVKFNGSGTLAINDSYNVTSVTDNSTGNYTVNIANDFGSASWSGQVSNNQARCWINAMAAGTLQIYNADLSVFVDASLVCATGHGDF